MKTYWKIMPCILIVVVISFVGLFFFHPESESTVQQNTIAVKQKPIVQKVVGQKIDAVSKPFLTKIAVSGSTKSQQLKVSSDNISQPKSYVRKTPGKKSPFKRIRRLNSIEMARLKDQYPANKVKLSAQISPIQGVMSDKGIHLQDANSIISEKPKE